MEIQMFFLIKVDHYDHFLQVSVILKGDGDGME